MRKPIPRTSVPGESRWPPASWALPRALAVACLLLAQFAHADMKPASTGLPPEDGYRLWLRYVPVAGPWRSHYRAGATELVGADGSPTLQAAHAELLRGLTGLLQLQPQSTDGVTRDGAIVFGTPHSSALVKSHGHD